VFSFRFSETIHEYGHLAKWAFPQMFIFDDSTPTNVEKYFTDLSQLNGLPDLLYEQIVSVAPPVKDMPLGLFDQPRCRRW
jgi:hypothetical protein